MKCAITILFISFTIVVSFAQGCQTLVQIGGGWDVLFDDKINKVCVSESSESSLEVVVEYSGFKDKKYIMIGKVLDSRKKLIDEIPAVKVDLNYNSNSGYLQFEAIKIKSSYTAPAIYSATLEITIAESEALADWGTKSSYKLERTWSIPGINNSSNIIVPVKLIPFKTTANPTFKND